MTTPIKNFNVVLVGEGFPVSTIDMKDFAFRGRKFQEQLRVGPTVQASSRNVQLLVLPDRFQVGVVDPDDLGIVVQGVREVISTFREYIGKRSLTAIGHNAQVVLSEPGIAARILAELVNEDLASDLLGVSEIADAQVTLVAHRGRETTMKVMAATVAESTDALLDFNFDFNIAQGEVSVDEAMSELEASLRMVEGMHAKFVDRFVGTGAATS